MSSLAILEKEILRLHDEREKMDAVIAELREVDERSRFLEEELRRRVEEVEQLNKDRVSLEQKVQELTGRKDLPSAPAAHRRSSTPFWPVTLVSPQRQTRVRTATRFSRLWSRSGGNRLG